MTKRTRYEIGRDQFVQRCGDMTPDELDRALDLWEQSIDAAERQARDKWDAFMDDLMETRTGRFTVWCLEKMVGRNDRT